jgi:hypothetical protein
MSEREETKTKYSEPWSTLDVSFFDSAATCSKSVSIRLSEFGVGG